MRQGGGERERARERREQARTIELALDDHRVEGRASLVPKHNNAHVITEVTLALHLLHIVGVEWQHGRYVIHHFAALMGRIVAVLAGGAI